MKVVSDTIERFKKKKNKQTTKSKILKVKTRIERKEKFTSKEKNKSRNPLSITYNRILPNLSKIVNRN